MDYCEICDIGLGGTCDHCGKRACEQCICACDHCGDTVCSDCYDYIEDMCLNCKEEEKEREDNSDGR